MRNINVSIPLLLAFTAPLPGQPTEDILSIPVGSYAEEVRLLDYETLRRNIKVLSDAPWNIHIEPEAYELEEVIVLEKADDSNIRSVQMAYCYDLSSKKIVGNSYKI